MVHYRAIRANYGFRGRLWERDDVAENVTEEEKIPDHFERLSSEEIPEKPKHESFDPPEPSTLSDWQNNEGQTEPPPGLEDRRPQKQEKPKPRRK